VNPPGEAKPDWQIFCELAGKMGFAKQFPFKSAEEIFTEISKYRGRVRIVEKKSFLKRVFSLPDLFEIGKRAGIQYFQRYVSCWEIDEDEASFEIAKRSSSSHIPLLLHKQ
jgi:anaerobic selenocysteine-containing dehydrogenase